MKTVELKNGLHQIIDSIEDNQLLEATYDFLLNHRANSSDIINSQIELEQMIQMAEEDIKTGRIHSHDEVKAFFDKKLSK